MKIQIRLIEKSMQITKFQIFQRAFLDFNGTVMIRIHTERKRQVSFYHSYARYWFKKIRK
jgi:hypothetical protein